MQAPDPPPENAASPSGGKRPPRALRASPLRVAWQMVAPTFWVLLTAAAVLGALAWSVHWLLRTPAGTAWLIDQVPGVRVEGAQGALLSSRFEARRIEYAGSGRVRSVVIENLVADGLVWRWRPDGHAWIGLEAQRIAIERLSVATNPPVPGTPPPDDLRSPLSLNVDALAIGTAQLDGHAPVQALQARLRLGSNDGGRHVIDTMSFEWDRVRGTAQGHIETDSPLQLDLQAQLVPREGDPAAPEWAAAVTARGPLQRFDTRATLRGTAAAGRTPPSLDLRAGIAPFASWPLASLGARTEALDLGALSSSAPRTRLSGSVEIQSSSLDAAISAAIDLENQSPGRWSEGRLPVRRLELGLRALNSRRDRVDLTQFDIVLGNAVRDAGRWRGSGFWQGDRLELESTTVDLRPQQLDDSAPALVVSGPLALVLRGLPAPGPSASTSASRAVRQPWSLDLRGTLDGRLDGSSRTLQVQADATLAARSIEIRQMRASAGAATAQLNGLAERQARGGWTVTTQGSLVDFDPLLWWPGAEGSAWRQGPHRISGGWTLDLQLPADAQTMEGLRLAQSTPGNGSVRIVDSVIAGVPLQGTLTLAHAPTSPARSGPPGSARGEVRLGSNRIAFEAQGDPLGDGGADRWHVDVKADALAVLAPLARLLPSLAEWAPREGVAEITLNGQGRWPDVRTDGQARVDKLRLGDARLASGRATWQLNSASDQPLAAQLDLAGLKLGRQSMDLLRADLQGTLLQHRLRLDAALPLNPPAIADALLGLRSDTGTRAHLEAAGAWVADGAGGGSWRGRIAELTASAWDGKAVGTSIGTDAGSAAASAVPSAAPVPGRWIDARDLRAELRFDAQGSLIDVRADPGRVRLAETVALRWDEVRVDMRGERPDFQLRAEIEPFLAAPMLARAQPSFGWGGDLRLAGTLDIKAAERFDADVVFERRGGDLFVQDSTGRQSMGLTDLRLAMAAHDGRWIFTQGLAGTSVGEAAGALSLQTTPQRRWPDSRSPIEGVIEARVANLGIWGAWVPPGWRLTGALTTSASVGGRLDAPDFTGQILGTNVGVRNLLQGVDVTAGDVAIQLTGPKAKIERFSFRGGDGELQIQGEADLGTRPVARLQMEARRFRVVGRIDRQLVASGKGTLVLQPASLKLDADLKIDEGLFDLARSDAPTLDDDVTIRAPQSAPTREAGETTRPRRDTQVAVTVDLGSDLRVRGRGLDTELAGLLRIATPGGRLAIRGEISAVDGTYAAYGQKLDIERGVLSFSGPPENPSLDILALRPNIDMRVGVAISGSFVSPRVRLYSDPDMSDTDKLSWLVLGRASDGLGRADTSLLQRAAVALLAGEGEAPTDAFLRNIGLDELSLRQGDGEVRETVIALGKQLSRRWYLGYERGVNATSGTWQLIYRIAQRFTLRAQSGDDNSLDLIWTWRLGEAPLPAAGAAPAASAVVPKSRVLPP